MLETLHAEPAAGLAYFCTAAEVGGLRLLGHTLQICCKVRRCSCRLGIHCECLTDLAQLELQIGLSPAILGLFRAIRLNFLLG